MRTSLIYQEGNQSVDNREKIMSRTPKFNLSLVVISSVLVLVLIGGL
ncbi:MAG: hypothetical protein H7175_07740 [Burkholderiales bacterium]|nr:hypothetical protein [Anaerolineae bacterium]